MSSHHPTDDELQRLLGCDGGLPEAVERHLSQCTHCRERLDALSGAAEFSLAFEPVSPGPDRVALMALQPSDKPGAPGCLGRYEVSGWLATSTTAVVWRAVDPDTGGDVAIKLLHPMQAAQPEVRSRFIREARAGQTLRHPSILPVLDLNEQHDPPFFVMPFASGGTLQQRLTGNPLPLAESLRIAKSLASALVAAHAAGVVHRDIKPANVLFASSDEVLLADFGIARALDQATLLTQTGSFLGTPQYMSPEQAAGFREVDERSDLFSLGALLFQLISGREPFQGTTFQELSRSVQEHAPADLNASSDVPTWLHHLVLRMLAKRPEDRPASASEVLDVLEKEIDLGRPGSSILAGGDARKKLLQRRLLWRVAVAGLLGLLALLWTERAGQTSVVNHLLCAISGESYYITGKWGTFGLLDQAVNAATDGDTIEVRTNEPATNRGGLRVPKGKSLTLRAAPGFRPVLQLQAAGVPALAVIDSPFTMEGFVFVHTTKALRAGRLIHMRGAPLTMINCRFIRQPRPPEALQSTIHAVIAATDSPRIEFIDCELYAPGSPLLGLISEEQTTAEVQFTRCHLWGVPLWCDDKPPATLQVTMTACEVFATDMLHFHQAAPAEDLILEVSRSIVQAYGSVIHYPWPDSKLASSLRWEGSQNHWFLPGQFALTQDGRQLDPPDENQSHVSRELAMPFSQSDFQKMEASGPGLRISIPKK